MPLSSQDTITATLGILKREGIGTYLGLPCLIGGPKKEIFQFLKDRVWKKLNGCKGKVMSPTGKVGLIKNVVQAILPMSCFLMPTYIICSLNFIV